MSQNILVCTLGISWAVIPEVFGFLAPERLPLYRRHPDAARLEALRASYGLAPPDEIWVCTTEGQRTREGVAALRQWAACLSPPAQLRVWQAAGTDQLADQEECLHMRELILRAVSLAHERAAGGQVTLSLAGGRKTMSADMQLAGDRFGCGALIHVVGKEPLPEALGKLAVPEAFAVPLNAELCPSVLPLIAGTGRRSELLDIDPDGAGPATGARFPLPLAPLDGACAWPAPDAEEGLARELERRERESGQLLGNYLRALSEAERHENWRGLYRLPPRFIERLRRERLDESCRDWLDGLPKADLHRHLGGCLDPTAQRETARAVWDALKPQERAAALDRVAPLLRSQSWEWNWPRRLRDCGARAHAAAALLLEASEAQLHRHLFGDTEPRVALKTRHPQGFAAYERPGELSGSTLLEHPAAILPYARAVVRQAVAERLAYVELRGSPAKYCPSFLDLFHAALQTARAEIAGGDKPEFRFILIGDRRRPDDLSATVEQAVLAKARLGDFVAGIDLAGDEGAASPEALAPRFARAFEACLRITIHAGEGEPAESIWQAAYRLHADRIGHGLTLGERPELAQRFRDRGICLELCPTSNREVVGFHDPAWPETRDCAAYPLLDLWRRGLPLTLCTDNPAIGRTGLAEEYLTAARMSGGELSLWDTLAMIKQGFVHAFLPADDKEKLLKRLDAEIYASASLYLKADI